jgi:hypothetical protein
MKGWVYIITNPSIPNVLKVGCSKNDPKLRAEQFNTGAPDDYVVEYDALVDGFHKIEKESHFLLKDYNKNKEWFNCDISIAILAIRQAANYSVMHEFLRAKKEIELEIKQLDELIAWADENKFSEDTFPRNRQAILAMTKLNLWNEHLTEVPEAIGILKKLTKLTLQHSQVKRLPDSIGKLTNLNKLNLQGNQLVELPESIGNLKNLTKLYLWENNLTGLPESMGNLTQLTMLWLADNQLTIVPNFISNLKKLTDLNLSYNEITEIPDFIGSLLNLEELRLSANKITHLPKSISQLYLTLFDIGGNNIKYLPSEFNRFKDAMDAADFY